MLKFSKGAGDNELIYPLTTEAVRTLEKCDLASPRAGRNYGVTLPVRLCNEAGRKEAAEEVVKVRKDVNAGKFPRWFMEKYAQENWGKFPEAIPELLANKGLSFDDPGGLANVVHMDNPLDLGAAMLDWLLPNGARPNKANPNVTDFLEYVPNAMSGLAQYVEKALKAAFDVKWYYGVPRPEEVLDRNMTHYPEGCPTHPSFPAGHGAAAFRSALYFIENWNLTPEQKTELLWAAYIWSMARTFAGVHYAEDNLTFAPMEPV